MLVNRVRKSGGSGIKPKRWFAALVLAVFSVGILQSKLNAGCNSPDTGDPVTLDFIIEDEDGNEITDYRFLTDSKVYACLTVDGETKSGGLYFARKPIPTASTGTGLSSGLFLTYSDGEPSDPDDCTLSLDDAGFTYEVSDYLVEIVIAP